MVALQPYAVGCNVALHHALFGYMEASRCQSYWLGSNMLSKEGKQTTCGRLRDLL